MNEREPVTVTVRFNMKVLTTLPQFKGMRTVQEVVARVQEDLHDFSVLMDHMADYQLDIKVEPSNA